MEKQYDSIRFTVAIVATLSTVSIFVPLNWLPLFYVVLFQGLAAISSGIVAVLEAVLYAINQRSWRIGSLMHQGKYQAVLELLMPIISGMKFDVHDVLIAANCYFKLGDISEGNKLIERALAMPGRTV